MNEIVCGIHTIRSILEHDPNRFQEVFILKGRKDKRLLSLILALKMQGVEFQIINQKNFNEKSSDTAHQGIIAYVKSRFQYQEKYLKDLIKQFKNPFFLILDGVTDIRNFGACLRSAEAAGVHAVIIPKHHSAYLNSTARKIACGAAESIPVIRVFNLIRTIRMLKEENIRIIGTACEAINSLYHSKMTGSMALVMGSEDKGIRHLTRKYCNEIISIPMLGSVSSLNTSVATGICLFEAVRQRNFLSKDIILIENKNNNIC